MKPLGILLILGITNFACKPASESVVFVKVTADTDVQAIHQLRVELENAKQSDTEYFPKTLSKSPITIPATFVLTIDRSHSGILNLEIEGLAEEGKPIARGDGFKSIDVGKQVNLLVNLKLIKDATTVVPLDGSADTPTLGLDAGLGSGGNAVGDTRAGTGGSMAMGGIVATGGVHDASMQSGGQTSGSVDAGGGDPCETFAEICGRLNACSPFGIQLIYGDLKTCIERMKLHCKNTVKVLGIGKTLAAMAACSQAIKVASCNDIMEDNVPACDFMGERVNGETCGADEQCKSGYCSNISTLCGACSNRATAGATCQSNHDCQQGLVCNQANTCVVPSVGKMACSEIQPCIMGYYCLAGSCAITLSNIDAACDDVFSCDISQGRYCNLEAKRCQKIKMAEAGSACGLIAGEVVACSAGECKNSANGLTKVCSAFVKDGDMCKNSPEGDACMDPARCIEGRCTLPNSTVCL